MPDKLVPKTEGRVVEHPVLSENDRVLQRAAANQTVSLQLFHFVVETECSGRCDELRIVGPQKLNVDALFSDQRVREIDIVFHAEGIRWVDAQRLLPVFENKLFCNSDALARPALPHDPNVGNSLGVRQRAPIQDRNLEVVELDVSVIDADPVKRREQVLDCGDPYASAHERRCVRNASDRRHVCSKLEIVQIDSAENDALSCRSGKDAHRSELTRMKADSLEFNRARNGSLVHQRPPLQFAHRISLRE